MPEDGWRTARASSGAGTRRGGGIDSRRQGSASLGVQKVLARGDLPRVLDLGAPLQALDLQQLRGGERGVGRPHAQGQGNCEMVPTPKKAAAAEHAEVGAEDKERRSCESVAATVVWLPDYGTWY